MTKTKIKSEVLAIALRTRNRDDVFNAVNEIMPKLCKNRLLTYAHVQWIE